MSPKLFLSGEFIFESEGKLLAQDENLLVFMAPYQRCFPFLQLSSHCLLPICTTRTCTKANVHLKKPKPGVFILLLSLTPSVLLLLLWPSVVLLSSLHGIYVPNCHLRHSTWCHISCGGGVSEKTQWHLSARRREWVGRNIAENKIEQQKEQQN